MGRTGMVKRYSIEEARANLASVVQEAEDGTQVELTRQGRTVAVLLGLEDFERLGSVAYEEFRQRLASPVGDLLLP
jgi:prevent-host-death family protein